jgi:glycosyltransferase involved in cell wall biosynthesis
MPAVSVIIPTYNRARFLGEAIESVLNQSYRDFELIVIDDGSEDETEQIVRSYGNHITYHFQKNAGISCARNKGLHYARGEHIAFLDSDDLWKKQKLHTQMDYFKKNADARICYTDESWIRNGLRVNPKKIHQKYSGWIFHHCIPLCIISLSSAMMHRKLFQSVGSFDEQLPACEDYDLWLRVSLVTPIHFIPKQLIVKRGGHEDQLSHKYWGMDRFRITALEKILTNPHMTEQQREAVIRDIIRRCEILATGSQKRGNIPEWTVYDEKKRQYESVLR